MVEHDVSPNGPEQDRLSRPLLKCRRCVLRAAGTCANHATGQRESKPLDERHSGWAALLTCAVARDAAPAFCLDAAGWMAEEIRGDELRASAKERDGVRRKDGSRCVGAALLRRAPGRRFGFVASDQQAFTHAHGAVMFSFPAAAHGQTCVRVLAQREQGQSKGQQESRKQQDGEKTSHCGNPIRLHGAKFVQMTIRTSCAHQDSRCFFAAALAQARGETKGPSVRGRCREQRGKLAVLRRGGAVTPPGSARPGGPARDR